MIFQLSFSFPATPQGPGPNVSLAIDAPDVVSALEQAKEPLRKWVEQHARNLHDALPVDATLTEIP
jgi:hypothetical protein